MKSKLGREIGDRSGFEHARMRRAPGQLGRQILLQATEGIVHATVQHELGGTVLEPLRREFRQQGEWIVVELSPANRIEFTKDLPHVGLPGPPHVAGQGFEPNRNTIPCGSCGGRDRQANAARLALGGRFRQGLVVVVWRHARTPTGRQRHDFHWFFSHGRRRGAGMPLKCAAPAANTAQ